ncbi:MCE family protein [Actinomadura rayongensis]|uniref:MCE family protein n=1 Tax=Actinomadura rayongensis TaxID=1429076 RepID=A0A6I4WI96_9ACTN|nr:MCE family protein [Actinomadura rayongensis]MXQ68075.1 MCE family protein [Actinomadura rayongensis]
MRNLTAPLIKSALFIFVTVLATLVLAMSIAQTTSGKTTGYKARFTDASGLRVGDSVRIAGVQVGRVKSVEVKDQRIAQVSFTVEKDRVLPATSTATIKYLNLVGARFIELDRGTGSGGSLAPGATIPVDRTTPALNLTELFNGFRPLFAALSPADVNKLATSIVQIMQGEGGTVQDLLSTVGSLTGAIADKDKVIGEVVDNLTTVLDTVNSRGDELSSLITTLRQLVSGLAADRKPIGDAISALDDLATSTASLLSSGRPALKSDIAQLGRLSNNLNRDQPTIQRFLDTLPQKEAAIGRLGTYGSWMNFYLCEATVSGVKYQTVPGGQTPPDPTGVQRPTKGPGLERCGGK